MIGCARQTVTETKQNLDGTQTVTVTKDHGFWESENLSNFYGFENNRVDKNAENVTKKIDAIKEHAMQGIQNAQTQTEKVLISTLAMVQLDHIATTPPPSGQQAPRTGVDMWDKNLLGLVNTGLNVYGIFGRDGDRSSYDDSPSIVNSGAGDVFYMSSNNKNPQYSLNATGESSVTGTFDLGLSHDASYNYDYNYAYDYNQTTTQN